MPAPVPPFSQWRRAVIIGRYPGGCRFTDWQSQPRGSWVGRDDQVFLVSLHDARAQLHRLVERAVAGEEIIITRNGRPAARLVSYAPLQQRRVFGRMRGRIRVAEDFDAPLPPDVLATFDSPD